MKLKKFAILPAAIALSLMMAPIAFAKNFQFWDLNSFIKRIKQSGFSTLKHELYYQSMLASPLLYISLVLIARWVSHERSFSVT